MPRLSRLLLTMLCLSLLATASPGSARAYTVQAGDTPLSIAKKHNISVDDLLKANKGLKPSKMKIGDSLTIPGGSSSKAEPAKESKKDKADKKSEPSSRKERAAEDRDRRQEKEPKSAPTKGGGHYTVKKGDTLGSIASKHGVSVDDLLKANKGLNPSRMGVGQEIALPGGPAPASAAKAEPAEKSQAKSHKAAEPEAHSTYTAHRKDTVDSVARKFHISPKELARLNPDMGKKLHSGQKLVVPLSKGKTVEEPEEAAPVRQAPARQAPPVVEEPAALPEKPSRAKAAPEATPSLPESRETADAEAAFEKGIEFGKQNKFQKAVESFDKAIKLNPNRADYFASRGHANYYLKQYPKAIDDYTKAIEKNPNFALAYSMRGLSRTRTEKYQQAIEDFNKAISFGPNEADYYKGRGFTYLHLKQYGPMCQDYQKSCTLGDCELLDSAKKEKLCQ
ncbi:LysM peptidoglycan-binding domain-containing protein [Solidesulfovibrio sp.]|uniref:LysM peptidoglycan-binding domain-containing protein n=1 Tax=Solidesulfovibrio sp. TaxID=2910990 RepID=UPI0026159D74|nr:LysM peptidoglycan-binding domain-containing protein [Solidesulfovibrio sp.]